jgi:hypothetical protein
MGIGRRRFSYMDCTAYCSFNDCGMGGGAFVHFSTVPANEKRSAVPPAEAKAPPPMRKSLNPEEAAHPHKKSAAAQRPFIECAIGGAVHIRKAPPPDAHLLNAQ